MEPSNLKWTVRMAAFFAFWQSLNVFLVYSAAHKFQTRELEAFGHPAVLALGALVLLAAIFVLYYSRIAAIFLALQTAGNLIFAFLGITNVPIDAVTIGKQLLYLFAFTTAIYATFKYHKTDAQVSFSSVRSPNYPSRPAASVGDQSSSPPQALTLFFWAYVIAGLFEAGFSCTLLLEPKYLLLADVFGWTFTIMSLVILGLALVYFSVMPSVLIILALFYFAQLVLGILAGAMLSEHMMKIIVENPKISFEILLNNFLWYKIGMWGWLIVFSLMVVYSLWYLVCYSNKRF